MLSADESLPVLRRTRPEGLGRAGRTAEASGPAQVPPPAAATCSLPLSLHAPGGPRQAVPALCAPRRTRAAFVAPRRWDSATAVVPSSWTTTGILTTQVKGVITTRQPFYSTVCGLCGCGLEVVATRPQEAAKRCVVPRSPGGSPTAAGRSAPTRAPRPPGSHLAPGPQAREGEEPRAPYPRTRPPGSSEPDGLPLESEGGRVYGLQTRGGFGEKGCVFR